MMELFGKTAGKPICSLQQVEFSAIMYHFPNCIKINLQWHFDTPINCIKKSL